nr:MAG TPA: hypothetical protein [Caudoviricetes sp.]
MPDGYGGNSKSGAKMLRPMETGCLNGHPGYYQPIKIIQL